MNSDSDIQQQAIDFTQQYEESEPISFEDRILDNQLSIIEDAYTQNKYDNEISQDILSKRMEILETADSSLIIDYSKTVVAKTKKKTTW